MQPDETERGQAAAYEARSPTLVTMSVWKALFLRETVHRLFGRRMAWLWVLAEPMVHIGFILFLFATVRVRVVSGIDIEVWIMSGLLSFFFFRRAATAGMNAIGPNKQLFTYRQVKPVDTIFVRAMLEGFLMLLVSSVILAGALLLGLPVIPDDPLMILLAVFGLWLNGLAWGLTTSVAKELVPELGEIISLSMTPLYFMSGVIFPLERVPEPYRDLLLINPLVHGVSAVRLGFASSYQAMSELNIGYLFGSAIVAIFFGLALQVRYSLRLATR